MPDTIFMMKTLIAFAKENGATDVDIKLAQDDVFSFGCRMGNPETIERSQSNAITIRLFKGKKKQSINASTLDEQTLKNAILDSLATIDELPEDPYCGLASPDKIAKKIPDLIMADTQDPNEDDLKNALILAEKTALNDPQITNSEGGNISWDRSQFYMVSSNGFEGQYERTNGSFYIQPVAGQKDQMQVDYDYSSAVCFDDLKDPETLGKKAAQKTIAKLNPKKTKTGTYPVVYDKEISASLLGLFMQAISGPNIAKGVSFLKNHLKGNIFPDQISIIDDPALPKGLGSQPFDGEGYPLSKIEFVKNGVLQQWLMDMVSARKLQDKVEKDTVIRGRPAKTNLYMTAGKQSPDELIADIKQGFYITSLMSRPDSLANGDYSVGASGFWIENGKITHPVHEATVSSNLFDMFKTLSAANDLEFTGSSNAPTVRIEQMTVAGE